MWKNGKNANVSIELFIIIFTILLYPIVKLKSSQKIYNIVLKRTVLHHS